MTMKKTIAFWERIMTSITFAEANEHDTARQILESKEPGGSAEHDVHLGSTSNTSLEKK